MINNDDLKVSVIVPLYNAQLFMTNSIQSILSQTYSNLEIILVDDGSTDNTLSICNEYKMKDNRIKVVHQDNSGPGSARNNGIENATGKFICFVDSDDYLNVKAIEIMMSYMEEDCDMIQCKSQKIINKKLNLSESWGKEIICIDKVEAMTNYLNQTYPIVRYSVWAKLIRRSAIGKLRFLNMKNSEDVVFNAYLINNCNKIKYIPETLYYVNVRDNSLSRKKITEDKINSMICCNSKILELIISNEIYNHLIIRSYWVSILTMMRTTCIVYGCNNFSEKDRVLKKINKLSRQLDVPMLKIGISKALMIFFFRRFPRLFVKVLKNKFI